MEEFIKKLFQCFLISNHVNKRIFSRKKSCKYWQRKNRTSQVRHKRKIEKSNINRNDTPPCKNKALVIHPQSCYNTPNSKSQYKIYCYIRDICVCLGSSFLFPQTNSGRIRPKAFKNSRLTSWTQISDIVTYQEKQALDKPRDLSPYFEISADKNLKKLPSLLGKTPQTPL